ncbi:MAG TPA: NUDIX domain-containing protein [Chitinophagaceae bacterium]|jgi:8-oxo-dGTP pyrophosphatase MutT (NUDIX family)|nr:NUDIX domain-containing protein [Chitinophagaceae bacterium]
MYIKIYFNDKPLFLCDTIDETIQPYVHHDDAVFIDELNAHTVKTMIHEMQQPQVHAGVFYHSDIEELKRAFQKKFTLIQAAGGLVKNEKNSILMILRRGKWDLPKGKLNKAEKLEDCAVREVEEETGLKNTKLNHPLTVTYHTYHEGTKYILKESHWFSMSVTGEQKLTPQIEEDISDIKWIDQKDIDSYLNKTFPLISDIIQSAKEKAFIAF